MDGCMKETLCEMTAPQGQGPMDFSAQGGWREKQARNRLGNYGHEKHTNAQLKPSPKPNSPKLPGRQGAEQTAASQMQVYC